VAAQKAGLINTNNHMKKDILKTAGVRSEKEFYKKYPTEEAFIAAHPDFANKMQMGGTREAFPQTATMDNFFSYGVPAPPNYLAHGGMPHAFPQAQTESQFFIPIYTDVYNPYNKQQGGSMPEMFPQVGNVEYQPPANMWFQEGGEPLEEVGVQNRLGKFMAQIGGRAATAANKQVGQSAMGMMRAGGNLSKYDPGGSIAPGKYKSVSDFVTQNPLDAYTGTQFQYDPAYGDAFAKYIDSMYRDYYELDPDHAVYKDDPIYKQLSEAYGYKGKPTNTSTSTPKYDLNQLASDRTSRGRGPVKSKGWVNGEFGRGRNNDYMWQTMFINLSLVLLIQTNHLLKLPLKLPLKPLLIKLLKRLLIIHSKVQADLKETFLVGLIQILDGILKIKLDSLALK